MNRVVKLGRDESGRKFVQVEPDARHVPLVLKTACLIGKSTTTIVPGVNVTDAELERRLSEPALSKSDTSAYMSCGMRPYFLPKTEQTYEKQLKQLQDPRHARRQVHGRI